MGSDKDEDDSYEANTVVGVAVYMLLLSITKFVSILLLLS